MNRRQPAPPSHLTRAMVVKHLKAAGCPLSRQRVDQLVQRGKALEGEMWDGTLLVPRWRVNAYMDARLEREA